MDGEAVRLEEIKGTVPRLAALYSAIQDAKTVLEVYGGTR
jgi:hypothetical protein